MGRWSIHHSAWATASPGAAIRRSTPSGIIIAFDPASAASTVAIMAGLVEATTVICGRNARSRCQDIGRCGQVVERQVVDSHYMALLFEQRGDIPDRQWRHYYRVFCVR